METTCNAAETTFCRKDLSLLPRGLQALYDDFSCQVTRNIYRILANIYKQTACKYLIFVKKWQAHLNIVFQDEHVKWRMGSFPVRGYGFDRCNILVHYISRWRLRHQMKTTPPNNFFLSVCRLVFSSAAKLFDVGPLVSFTGFCTSHYLTIYKNNTRRIIKNNITISGKLGPDPRHRHQEFGSGKSSTQT